MSAELSIYINTRINEMRNTFNLNISRLNNILASNILTIKKSRKLNSKQKQQQINSLVNQFNTNYKALFNKLNNNISTLKNFKPNQIVINKNKKALLIGINYVDTPNQLNGCINDIDCIRERISKSGFDNIPSFLEVLFNLYQYPGTIIDYKLISPSAIDYINKGRIGSVFSSFYFRASIMNPALVHNIRMNFFPDARNILTPTLGWCSYLTGFSLLKERRLNHYVGIDVIDRVCNQHPLTLYPPSKIDVFNCPSELVMERHTEFTTCYRGYFDAVFFSPPYFKMELYDATSDATSDAIGGENQSTTMYKTYDEWLKGYWEKTVIMCRETLNPNGGTFCYIVSPFDKYDLPRDLENITKKYFTLQHIVPIYNKGVNSTKHREPDDKLYIYTPLLQMHH